MAHILATLHGLEKDVVEELLHAHKFQHELDGLHLEHLWSNAEDDEEVIFLFKTDNVDTARLALEKIHRDCMRHNPEIEPPEMITLRK
jgi:hypothetical protein